MAGRSGLLHREGSHSVSAVAQARTLNDAKALVAVLQRDLGPDDKEDRKTKDAIWQMGKDLCKDRPDHPECARFKKKEEEEEEQVEQQVAPAPAPAPVEEAAVPAPAPVEKAAVPAPAPAQVEKVVAPAPSEAPAQEPAAEPLAARRKIPSGAVQPAKLPEQGFHGEDVAYKNGHNINADWRDEYGTLPTDAEFKLQMKQKREREAREKKERERKEAERSFAGERPAGSVALLALALPLYSALSL